MTFTNVQLLIIVIFLHYFCNGVVLPFLPLSLIENGATFITVGLLNSLTYLFHLSSTEFLALIENGKKYTLTFCQFYCFLYYFVCVFYTDVAIVFLMRCLFAMTTRPASYTKAYIRKTEPENHHVKYFNVIYAVKVTALALGAITGGYVYKCDNNFSSNCMIGSVFTLLSILILQSVDDDINNELPQSKWFEIPSKCVERLQNLRDFDYEYYWEALVINIAYITTFSIYFSKFSFIVQHIYGGDSVHLGQAVAFDALVTYLCSTFVPFVINEKYNKKILLEDCLVICGFSLLGLMYAPSYECHLFFFIPVLMTYSLINHLIKNEDALELQENEEDYEVVTTLTEMANTLIPFFLGFIWHFFGVSIFKVTCLLPMVICVGIVSVHVVQDSAIIMEEDDEDEREEVEGAEEQRINDDNADHET